MQLKEWRIYFIGSDLFPINGKEHHELSDEEFMTIAEQYDGVRSLKGFEGEFNTETVSTQERIRFISVPINETNDANALDPEAISQWIKTHFEIVRQIVLNIETGGYGKNHAVTLRFKHHGRVGLSNLAEEWTDEFECRHRGRNGMENLIIPLEEFLRLKQLY